MVSTETHAQKSKEEKDQNTNIRFVLLLRILFRYSKINTFPLTVHCVLKLFCQVLYKKQRWDLRWVDLTVRWRYNTLACMALLPRMTASRSAVRASRAVMAPPYTTRSHKCSVVCQCSGGSPQRNTSNVPPERESATTWWPWPDGDSPASSHPPALQHNIDRKMEKYQPNRQLLRT